MGPEDRGRAGKRPGGALLPPSPWVVRYLGGIAGGGHVLDVACGGGRHTRLALSRGYRVTAIDRDLAPLSPLAGTPGLEAIEGDLETGAPFPLAGRTYDGVIVTNYLWRPILADIVGAVGPGGVLIYETFAVGQERLGRPSNPEFLLAPGELVRATACRLVPIAYEHATVDRGRPRVVQRIVAVAPDHAWVLAPPTAAMA